MKGMLLVVFFSSARRLPRIDAESAGLKRVEE
jgi:hypothetical protein